MTPQQALEATGNNVMAALALLEGKAPKLPQSPTDLNSEADASRDARIYQVIQCLDLHDEPTPIKVIADELDLSTRTASTWLGEAIAAGVVSRSRGKGNLALYQLAQGESLDRFYARAPKPPTKAETLSGEEILKLLGAKGEMTMLEIFKEIGISKKNTSQRLHKLSKDGKVERRKVYSECAGRHAYAYKVKT